MKNNQGSFSAGPNLELSDAKKFLKKKIGSVSKQMQLKSKLKLATTDLSFITDNMADSLYNKFYWDYATEEELIEGYRAILVPIILDQQLNSSLIDGMSPKGYRVAVFQCNYSKTDILLGFRDYHPNEQIVRDRMEKKKIAIYPTDFIAFHDVLGDDFTGHVLHLDQNLNFTRLTEVNENRMINYLNIPSDNPLEENPLVEYEFEEIFSIEDKQCKIQIAYPDLEISYTREKVLGNGPAGQIGSNTNGFELFGFAVGTRTVVNFNAIWRTESIPISGCSIKTDRSVTLSNGVGFSGAAAGQTRDINDDCFLKMRLKGGYENLEAIRAIVNFKNSNGINVEAGFNIFVKDLSKLGDKKVSNIYTNNDPQNVKVPFTWNRDEGYVLYSSHNHPGRLPPSIVDVFAMGVNAYTVANSSHSVTEQKSLFASLYTEVIEVGDGRFYAMSISNIDRLILKTYGNSIGNYKNNLQNYLDIYQKVIRDKTETAEIRLSFLLNYFSDCITLYEGQRDSFGNLEKLSRLNYQSENEFSKHDVNYPE